MGKLTIDQVDVASRRVLMRVDFNVPLDEGAIADDRRIRMALPSIRSVLDRGGRIILMSHLGRPKGEGYEPGLSLEPCATRLSELLDDAARNEVKFPSHDCIDGAATASVEMLADGEVILLENLRFHEAEKQGGEEFAERLAAYGDIYCNDAFGACHRKDASMVGVPKAMGGKPKAVGRLVEKEIRYLSETVAEPVRPFVVVLGGAKVSDKIPAIRHLMRRANTILIGGAMSYTFLAAQGHNVGSSRVERELLDDARSILNEAGRHKCEIVLPVDHVCSTEFSEQGGETKTFSSEIEEGWVGLDIGTESRARFTKAIAKARTIVWNGPMGVFEWSLYEVGTKQMALAIADATGAGAVSIVGGGDSAAAAEKFGVADRLSHVSTGGGASLEMLSGKEFEAVSVLDDA